MNVTRNQDESRKHYNNSGWSQRDSAEREKYAGVLTDSGITENNITNADRPEGAMLEEILSPSNLNQAYKRVKKNRGAGGVDGMKVEDLLQYLKDNGEEIRQTIKDGKYRPQPVRRVEIPKENGKKRKLGIPTAVDRVIQQAIAQVLTPIYEPQFSDNSYGFRPGRSTHDAIRVCQKNIRDGYKYEDMVLTYYDTLKELRLLDIAVLKGFCNQTIQDVNHQKLKEDLGIDDEQFHGVENKLIRMGLLSTQSEQDIKNLYNNIDRLVQIIGDPDPHLSRRKSLGLRNTLGLPTAYPSKFGLSFLKYFIEQQEVEDI